MLLCLLKKLHLNFGLIQSIFSPHKSLDTLCNYAFLILFQKVTFSEGGETYEMWRKPPVDVYLKVYLFNVTNREAFLQGKEHLKVQEVGPYVYK